MRTLTKITMVALLPLLSACGSPDYGYYDNNGNWIAPTGSTETQRRHSPSPGLRTDDRYYNDDVRVIRYERPGYYDYYGNYITVESRVGAPRNMLPPRGMCRVWFPDRVAEDQPRVESCNGIQYRVPAGAYVIYGG